MEDIDSITHNCISVEVADNRKHLIVFLINNKQKYIDEIRVLPLLKGKIYTLHSYALDNTTTRVSSLFLFAYYFAICVRFRIHWSFANLSLLYITLSLALLRYIK